VFTTLVYRGTYKLYLYFISLSIPPCLCIPHNSRAKSSPHRWCSSDARARESRPSWRESRGCSPLRRGSFSSEVPRRAMFRYPAGVARWHVSRRYRRIYGRRMGQPTQRATNYTARSNIDTAQIVLCTEGFQRFGFEKHFRAVGLSDLGSLRFRVRVRFTFRFPAGVARWHLAYTGYCHCRYCTVYGIRKGGRWEGVYCAMVVQ